jgi:hypothetical protein
VIIGLSLSQFTTLHVAISLIAIVTGLIAMPAFAARRRMPRMTAAFLLTTMLTTLTGFLFPVSTITPAFVTGLVSTLVILVALSAIYGFGLRGRAGVTYAVSATMALWLNLFVLVVQAFLKVHALNALAVLIGMVALGWAAVRAARRRRRIAL